MADEAIKVTLKLVLNATVSSTLRSLLLFFAYLLVLRQSLTLQSRQAQG